MTVSLRIVSDWIDSRLPAANAKPGPQLVPKAAAAKDALLKPPAIDPKLQVDAARPLVDDAICAPGAPASDQMMDESGGIVKVFDVREATIPPIDAPFVSTARSASRGS